MIVYVEYERWFDFDEICDFLNYHVPGFNVSRKEQKDFRKALKSDIPNQIYKRHTWWKESNLIKIFCEKYPKVNFANAFRTYGDVGTIKHYADEQWFKDEYVRMHKVMLDSVKQIVENKKLNQEEIFELMKEYERAKITIERLVIKYLPKEQFAHMLHSANKSIYINNGGTGAIDNRMLNDVINLAKKSKRFEGETLENVLSKKATKRRND